jgi:hypothetical protein
MTRRYERVYGCGVAHACLPDIFVVVLVYGSGDITADVFGVKSQWRVHVSVSLSSIE